MSIEPRVLVPKVIRPGSVEAVDLTQPVEEPEEAGEQAE